MLKMQREKQNSGMSLVEVIISMLVLSIAVVTVLSAFSMASKTNLQSKKHQCVESLMENFIEYAEAGGTEYGSYFSVSADTPIVAGAVTTETFRNVRQGYFDFDVEVTTDTAPAEYAAGGYLNDRKIIQFGGSGSKSVLIDASQSAVASNGNDADAINYFHTWHTIAIENQKAAIDADDTIPEADKEDLKNDLVPETSDQVSLAVDRELWISAVASGTDKMRLQASFRYKLTGIDLPAGVDNVYTSLIYMSDEFDRADATSDSENKLDQIYVLYSEPKGDGTLANVGWAKPGEKDIRILDGTNPGDKKLDAIMYLVEQEETLKTYNPDDATPPQVDVTADLGTRISGRTFRISFNNPIVAGVSQTPQKLEIYCSGEANFEGDVTNVIYEATDSEGDNKNANNIVAKGNEIRVVTVTIKVLEQGTGKVLSTKEITRLQ